MNFIPCQIVQQEQQYGVLLKTGKEQSFFLPINRPGLSLDSRVDRELILGVRPEQITHGFADQEMNPQIHEIETVVQVLEPTGPDTLVFVNINGTEVTCRVNPTAVKFPGEPMTLMIDMSKALLFDPNTEEKIGK